MRTTPTAMATASSNGPDACPNRPAPDTANGCPAAAAAAAATATSTASTDDD